MDPSTVTAITTFSLPILGIFIATFALRRLLVALIATIIILFLDRNTDHQNDNNDTNDVIVDEKKLFVDWLSGCRRRSALDTIMMTTMHRLN